MPDALSFYLQVRTIWTGTKAERINGEKAELDIFTRVTLAELKNLFLTLKENLSSKDIDDDAE